MSWSYGSRFTTTSCTIHGKIWWQEQVNFQWNGDSVHFVLDQYDQLDFYSTSSLKQQSAHRHVAPLGHIILIPSQTVFVLFPEWCVLSGEATHINYCIVFGLNRSGFELTIYCTKGERANHYTTDVVGINGEGTQLTTLFLSREGMGWFWRWVTLSSILYFKAKILE